jgi:hypothetical protein
MHRLMGKYLAGGACAVAAVLISAAAFAGDPCAAGQVRNWRGKCVESDLASSMRHRAIEMSQPKISETAGAVAPAKDNTTPKAADINRYELSKGNFSTNPNPPSR